MFAGLSFIIAIPLNSTLLKFPLSIPPSLINSHNDTVSPLQAWPQTPWTLPCDSNSITFYIYGRQASPDLEVEIISSLQGIYDQVIGSPLIGWHTLRLQSGNVAFNMVFHTYGMMTARSVASMLAEIQVLYLNDMNGPREILRADLMVGQERTTVAAFQIVFQKIATE